MEMSYCRLKAIQAFIVRLWGSEKINLERDGWTDTDTA